MGGLVRYRVQPGGKEEERGKCNFRTNCNSPTTSRTRWPLNWPDSPFLMRRFMIKCYGSIYINTSKEKVRIVYVSDSSNSSEYLNWRRTLSAHIHSSISSIDALNKFSGTYESLERSPFWREKGRQNGGDHLPNHLLFYFRYTPAQRSFSIFKMLKKEKTSTESMRNQP